MSGRLPYELRLQIGKALDRLVCDDSTPEHVDRFIQTFADFGLAISATPSPGAFARMDLSALKAALIGVTPGPWEEADGDSFDPAGGVRPVDTDPDPFGVPANIFTVEDTYDCEQDGVLEYEANRRYLAAVDPTVIGGIVVYVEQLEAALSLRPVATEGSADV